MERIRTVLEPYVKKRQLVLSSVFALFATLALVLGETNELIGWGFKEALCLAPIQFVVIALVLYGFLSLVNKVHIPFYYEPVRLLPFSISSAVLLVLWGISWVVFYPGYWTGDSMSSVMQSIGERNWSEQHPPLFTALMSFFILVGNSFGNTEFGMGLFTLFTLIVFAAFASYLAAWVYARTKRKIAFFGTVAFFAGNIVLAQYSITAWKDIYFSPLVVLLVLKLFDVVLTDGNVLNKKRSLVAIGILSLLVMLFRSNGILVVLPTLIVLLFVYRSWWKQILLSLLSSLLLFVVITGPVYSALNIESKSARESYAIPLQQIAKTIVDDGSINSESRSYLEQLVDFEEIKSVYDPYIVDPVKWADSFDEDFLKGSQLEFLQVWISLLPANMDSYIASFRDITLGYWYPCVDGSLIGYSGYDRMEGMFSWENAFWPESAVDNVAPVRISYSYDESVSLIHLVDYQRHLPVLNFVFSIGAMVWFLFMVVLAKLNNGEKTSKQIVSLLPLLFLWVSLMLAAPAYCEFRYILSLHLALPFLVCILFVKKGSFNVKDDVIRQQT